VNARAQAAQALRQWVLAWWAIGVLTLLLFGLVAVDHMGSENPNGASLAVMDIAYGLASLLSCVWLAHLSRGVAVLLEPASETAPADAGPRPTHWSDLSAQDRQSRWILGALVLVALILAMVFLR